MSHFDSTVVKLVADPSTDADEVDDSGRYRLSPQDKPPY